MSVLNDVLNEEYERLVRILRAVDNEIETLPKGYISNKTIKGKQYSYLQWREEDKVRSKYLMKEEVAEYRVQIDRRQALEKQKRELEEDKKKLEKVL